jgi:hypothetical protein
MGFSLQCMQQEHLSHKILIGELPEVDLSFLRNRNLKLYLLQRRPA